jgi:hypothetical protein
MYGIASVHERWGLSWREKLYEEILEQCNICIFVGQVWQEILGVKQKGHGEVELGSFVASINIHFHPICNVFKVNAKKKI